MVGHSKEGYQVTRYRAHAALTLTLMSVIFCLIMGRVFLESRDYFRKGTASLEADELYMAVVHFGRAAKWYFPGNPYVLRSLRSLWETGQRAEEMAEERIALKAYYTLRGCLYGTRWFYMPYREWLDPCNQRIADLTVVNDPHVSEETVLANLQGQVGPSVVWALFVVLGFWGWIGSVFGFVWFSFDASGSMDGRKAVAWGGVGLGFFVVWVLSMLRA